MLFFFHFSDVFIFIFVSVGFGIADPESVTVRRVFRLFIYSDGHTFVYSLLRYRYRYIVSNGRY
jgi:hypothetical protein